MFSGHFITFSLMPLGLYHKNHMHTRITLSILRGIIIQVNAGFRQCRQSSDTSAKLFHIRRRNQSTDLPGQTGRRRIKGPAATGNTQAPRRRTPIYGTQQPPPLPGACGERGMRVVEIPLCHLKKVRERELFVEAAEVGALAGDLSSRPTRGLVLGPEVHAISF